MFYCYVPMFVAKLCSNQLIWGGPALKIAIRERAGIMSWKMSFQLEIAILLLWWVTARAFRVGVS